MCRDQGHDRLMVDLLVRSGGLEVCSHAEGVADMYAGYLGIRDVVVFRFMRHGIGMLDFD